MVDCQARDMEVRGSNPGLVRIFLLKSKIVISQDTNYKFVSTYKCHSISCGFA